MRSNSMGKWLKGILVISACLLTADQVFAATMELDVGAGSVYWTNATAWTANTVPVNGDSIYIRRGNAVTIDTAVGSMNLIMIGDSSAYGYTGTVNIVTGGTLTTTNAGTGITSRSSVGRSVNGAVGYLNLNGGTFNVGPTGANVLQVGFDSSSSVHCTGIFTIDSGTFNGRLLVGSDEATDIAGSDQVIILGTGANIGTADTTGSALDLRGSGLLNFVFDATGISTMNYGTSGSGGSATFSVGSQIIVDGSSYTGGANTFTLISAGNLGVQDCSVVLTNFAAGTTYNWDTANDVFTVTTIPEPATIGTMVFGAVVLLLGRRRFCK